MTALQAVSSQTAIKNVLFVLRLYFWMEVVRLVIAAWDERDTLRFGRKTGYYFNIICINLAFAGVEVILSGLAIRKKCYKILMILNILMVVHLVILCHYFVYLFDTRFQGLFILARIYSVIGIGILVFALLQARAMGQWIKEGDKIDAMTVAYFNSKGTPYPAQPAHQVYPTAAQNPSSSNGSSHSAIHSCNVATVLSHPPMYPTTAPVHAQLNKSPNPSELACPAYPTVADVPYDTKIAPYPAEQTYPAYPAAVANPAVYPSLDTQVPIQNTNPPTHPSS